MSVRPDAVLRAIVVAAGLAVTVAGALALRVEDWPIYVAFVVLSLALFGPAVEVAPGLTLPMPGLALCLGFLCAPRPGWTRRASTSATRVFYELWRQRTTAPGG